MLHIQLNMIYLTDSAEKNNFSMESGIDIFWGKGNCICEIFTDDMLNVLRQYQFTFPI